MVNYMFFKITDYLKGEKTEGKKGLSVGTRDRAGVNWGL